MDMARTASQLLSAIAFSDHGDPIDLNLLSDDAGSSGDAGSSQPDSGSRHSRGHKRPADAHESAAKPAKKPKRSAMANVIATGTLVACLDRTQSPMWVLGRVDKYLPEVKKYEVLDDADGEEQTYRVFKRNIRVIPKKPLSLDPHNRVLAVYPNTTVFYPASLVRRGRGKAWVVEFDDEDDQEEAKFKEVDGRLIIQE